MPEFDPNGVPAKEPGSKLDGGKSPCWRGLLSYFPRACAAISRVSDKGAAKYSWKGWEKVKDGQNRYGDALIRHMLAEAEGDLFDADSGELHATHAAWNALARLELMLRNVGTVNPSSYGDLPVGESRSTMERGVSYGDGMVQLRTGECGISSR